MSDYPASFENLSNYLTVKNFDAEKRKKVTSLLKKGASLAFLVTANFEIYIGTTGLHKDIYSHLAFDTPIMEKGQISGGAKKILWISSDSTKDSEIKSEDVVKLQAAIKDKINGALDMEYYFQ